MYPSTSRPRISSPHLQQPPTATPPPASHATLCSLRGAARGNGIHPLKANPPSIAESLDESAGFDHVPLAPPPSALTSRPTHYDPHASSSPLDDYTPSSYASHQRSLTGTFFENCKPLVNRAASTLQQHTSRTSFHSPTKSLANFIPSRGGSAETTASQPKARAGKIFSDWFSGASAPVSLGIASAPEEESDTEDEDYDSEEEEEEEEEEEDDDDEGNMISGMFTRPPASTRSATNTSETAQTPSKPANSSTPNSKFGWLLPSQKPAVNERPPSPEYHNPSDELLKLNITQALFPHGPVDPLAPSSFHDLLSTAENLLTRYQNSYRAVSTALCDARAEQSAQDDELDEAETRVRHLKMQLETMAARATEQDVQLQKLREELALERQRRKEDEEARKKSLALVRGPTCTHHTQDTLTQARKKRVSNSDVSIDSGFESECDSEAASIFSRTNGAMSPTDTIPSSVASEVEDIRTTPTPKNIRPAPLQRISTYEKVVGGKIDLESGGWGCANCEGGAQSAVWGRLAKEREENRILRNKVDVLEDAVQGALSVVDGPWGI